MSLSKDLQNIGFKEIDLGINNRYYRYVAGQYQITVFDIEDTNSLKNAKQKEMLHGGHGIYLTLKNDKTTKFSDYFQKIEQDYTLLAILSYMVKLYYSQKDNVFLENITKISGHLNIEIESIEDLSKENLSFVFSSLKQKIEPKKTTINDNEIVKPDIKENFPTNEKPTPTIGNLM
jgi:hypothetical protein